MPSKTLCNSFFLSKTTIDSCHQAFLSGSCWLSRPDRQVLYGRKTRKSQKQRPIQSEWRAAYNESVNSQDDSEYSSRVKNQFQIFLITVEHQEVQ
jgi:hypothetical protein